MARVKTLGRPDRPPPSSRKHASVLTTLRTARCPLASTLASMEPWEEGLSGRGLLNASAGGWLGPAKTLYKPVPVVCTSL
eukprot:365052-Chlamydomonas_euryale.AAC.22